MSRVLVLGIDQPLPPHGGARLRILHLARQAARVHDVDVVAVGEPPEHVDEPFSLHGVPWAHNRYMALATSLHRPYQAARLASRGMVQAVEASPADIVQASSIYLVDAARHAGRPVVLDADNVETDVVRTLQVQETNLLHRWRWSWECRKTERFEREVVGLVDVVLACSDDDAATFEPMARDVVVVPNGVDVAAITPGPLSREHRIVYVGLYSYRPNERAALTLIDGVLPRLRQSHPTTTLDLVGADPTPAMQSRSTRGITITGRVDDVLAHVRRARALVIALDAGSGTRLKALEAMAAGVPVVSTPIGVAGLGVRDGHDVLIGRTPSELADQARRLLDDDELASHLAANARRAVESRFDWSVVAEPMLAAYSKLMDHRR